MASGPSLCNKCLLEVSKHIQYGGEYQCSSITRREDVIFAQPAALSNALGACYKSLLFSFSEAPMSLSPERAAELLCHSPIDKIIIWAGAGLTLASGLSPQLPLIPSERTHEDYERGMKGIVLAETKNSIHHELQTFARHLTEKLSVKIFVVSSNVDGILNEAGFVDILEIHGSVRHYQCSNYRLCGDTTLYSSTESRPQFCTSCQKSFRVAVTTAQDEDDDLVLTRHSSQVNDFRKFLGQISAKKKSVSSAPCSIVHIIVGVGGPENRDSLLSEILLLQQDKLPFDKHFSAWFNKEGCVAPSGLSNAIDIPGNLEETLPKFIDYWLASI